MSTYEFRPKFKDLVDEVLDLLQVGQDGETLAFDEVKRLMRTYNFMTKEWQGLGINLWTYTEGTLFLNKAQTKYVIGQNTGDNRTVFLNDFQYNYTTLASVAGANTLEFPQDPVLNIGDQFGVYLADNTIQWCECLTAIGDTVTIVGVLRGDVDLGAKVIRWDNLVETMPITRMTASRRMENIGRLQQNSLRVVPLDFVDRMTYMNLPDKQTRGSVTTTYFSRQRNGLGSQHQIYVWPSPPDSLDAVEFTYERSLQIVESPDDYLDFPEYWYTAIVYNLAARSTLKLGAEATIVQVVMAEAPALLTRAASFENSERSSEIRLNAYG